MNRWTRVNLLLATVAALLLLADRWPAVVAATPKLTRLDPAQVSAVRIERGDRLVLALQRDGNDWRLVHPLASAATTRRVEQLLAIAQAPVQHELGQVATPADYGLMPPRAVLQLDHTRLAFGALDPTRQQRYVSANGQVVTVDDVYFNLLTLPVRHFTAPDTAAGSEGRN